MKLAWGRAVALVVAASVMFGAAACARATWKNKVPPPKDVLVSSLSEYNKGVYALDFTALDGPGRAAVDSLGQRAYVELNSKRPDASYTVEVLLIEPDAYVKLNMGQLAEQPSMRQLNGMTWMRLDPSKVKHAKSLGLKADETDLLGLKAMLQSARSVKPDGDRKYTGTLDLAKGGESPLTDEDVVKSLGDKAAGVPFTAALDSDGRLRDLVIGVPAAGDKQAHQLKVSVTQYGAAAVPAKPAAKSLVEAPAKVYETLNG
ncbi:hypothetical protein [Dactylosporangium sp. CA-092794]|uniref:hypothetical protein n=1 Tax=Dactylosporangium sp. CA-092794 TaxID=3239929 RepID=UPI003D90CAD8